MTRNFLRGLRLAAMVAISSGRALTAADLPRWWSLGIEARGRFDSFLGLNCVSGKDDSYYLHRLRLNSNIKVLPWLHVVGQMQDSRAPGYDRRPVPFTVANPLDLRLGYVEAGTLGEQPWAIRIGRQPLIFGDMRLVSTSNWGNVGPAFDALRLTHVSPRMRLDWFAALPVVPAAGVDLPSSEKKLAGFYASFALRKDSASVDVYSLWKSNLHAAGESGTAGPLNVYTQGIRSTGKLARGFDYNLELAIQRGNIAQNPLSAWMGHWELGRRLSQGSLAPRAWMEYNYASGDSDAHDGRRQTFEQLYPSPLSVVGRSADFASRNLREAIAGVEWQPERKWKLRATYRTLWIASRGDALYTLSGAVFASRPDAPHTRIGAEAGVWAICQATRRLQLWLGYANLAPGPYLKEAGRTGAIRYPYVMWTYNVL